MRSSEPIEIAQRQTQEALGAMQAYFLATAQGKPRKERQRLASEWLITIRRLRVDPPSEF